MLRSLRSRGMRVLHVLPRRSRSGQGLIESCIVMAVVCLIFFCVFQISQLFAAQEVLDYAAGRGARARTVGFNRFMVYKTIRVGAIPNAGLLVNPAHQGGPAQDHAMEVARIPLYLGAQNYLQLKAILDYRDWDSIHGGVSTSLGNGTLMMRVNQDYYLTNNPLHRAFYSGDYVPLSGTNTLDEHYSLYMYDSGW
jgi:hypothetical protein